MSAETYELLSQGLRYWFVFLGLTIVIRSYRWGIQDHRMIKRALKALPDSGLIGEVVNLTTGESLPLPREGIMGSSRSSDVYFPGIRKSELEFMFVDGQGLHIIPIHRSHQILLQNEPLGKDGYALHGSRVNLPGYSLRVRLFAGLNLPQQAYSGMLMQESSTAYQDDFDIETLGDVGMPINPFGEEILIPESVFVSDPPEDLEKQKYMPEIQNQGELTWDPQLTWQYAPPPPEVYYPIPNDLEHLSGQPIWEQDSFELQEPESRARKRRSKRHEN